MEERKQYVVTIENFEFINSLGVKMELETKLYITKIFNCNVNEYAWDIWVGADDYGYKEFLAHLYTKYSSLDHAIEFGIDEYYENKEFQNYVISHE